MSKKAFYYTFAFFLVCLLAVAYAIYYGEKELPESKEGALMQYTCDDVMAYETINAEQDLEELRMIVESHINEYDPSIHQRLSSTLDELDSLRDEVAFHNNDVGMYRAHFRSMLNLISYAELTLAANRISLGEDREAMISVEHARHCLHDALFFATEGDAEAQSRLLDDLNAQITGGLTADGLLTLAGRL
jgi:hypothetical protein